jgi:hypothetical protein
VDLGEAVVWEELVYAIYKRAPHPDSNTHVNP